MKIVQKNLVIFLKGKQGNILAIYIFIFLEFNFFLVHRPINYLF